MRNTVFSIIFRLITRSSSSANIAALFLLVILSVASFDSYSKEDLSSEQDAVVCNAFRTLGGGYSLYLFRDIEGEAIPGRTTYRLTKKYQSTLNPIKKLYESSECTISRKMYKKNLDDEPNIHVFECKISFDGSAGQMEAEDAFTRLGNLVESCTPSVTTRDAETRKGKGKRREILFEIGVNAHVWTLREWGGRSAIYTTYIRYEANVSSLNKAAQKKRSRRETEETSPAMPEDRMESIDDIDYPTATEIVQILKEISRNRPTPEFLAAQERERKRQNAEYEAAKLLGPPADVVDKLVRSSLEESELTALEYATRARLDLIKKHGCKKIANNTYSCLFEAYFLIDCRGNPSIICLACSNRGSYFRAPLIGGLPVHCGSKGPEVRNRVRGTFKSNGSGWSYEGPDE